MNRTQNTDQAVRQGSAAFRSEKYTLGEEQNNELVQGIDPDETEARRRLFYLRKL